MGPPDRTAEALALLEAAWRPPGFCVPNPDTYPFQWLWDSCFHAVVWARLGRPDRAQRELESLFARQRADGFVPHVVYWADPEHHADFWGRAGESVLTQPPMFGHALAVLADEAGARGEAVGEADLEPLAERARAGLWHLVAVRRRSPAGLVSVLHPWETGCDDSLRWDDWAGAGGGAPFDRERWRSIKADLVSALDVDDDGVPRGSSGFEVGSVAFTALVAWNIRELDRVGLADARLREAADELVAALADRWDGTTWVDDPVVGGVGVSSRARTLEALLPVLVEERPEVRDEVARQLTDSADFGAPFGPRGAHRDEAAADPDGYWRGSTWPQLLYLLEAAGLETSLRAAAVSAEWSEYWNPETGRGRGARPQTWTLLGALPAR